MQDCTLQVIPFRIVDATGALQERNSMLLALQVRLKPCLRLYQRNLVVAVLHTLALSVKDAKTYTFSPTYGHAHSSTGGNFSVAPNRILMAAATNTLCVWRPQDIHGPTLPDRAIKDKFNYGYRNHDFPTPWVGASSRSSR